MEPTEGPAAESPRERLCYRDDEQFKKALDAAADRIRKAQGPDILGNVLWWGLIALQVVLLVSDWAFDWNIRYVLPGLDLVKPVWALLAAMVVWHLVWLRHQHPRIIRERLCLDCGRALTDVAVDSDGSGACPKCGREFNLGEYRRPMENRGRAFNGYLDGDHFDRTMQAVAEHLKSLRGFRLEGEALGWTWVALGVAWGVSAFLDWNLLEWVPDPIRPYGIWFICMIIWTTWYYARVRRIRPTIVDRRLCLDCGYSLHGTPEDDCGIGRCPECGSEFHAEQYVRPEEEEEEDEEEEEEDEE